MPRQRTNYRRRTYDFPQRPVRFQEESGLSWSEIARRIGDLSPHLMALDRRHGAAQRKANDGTAGFGRRPGHRRHIHRVGKGAPVRGCDCRP